MRVSMRLTRGARRMGNHSCPRHLRRCATCIVRGGRCWELARIAPAIPALHLHSPCGASGPFGLLPVGTLLLRRSAPLRAIALSAGHVQTFFLTLPLLAAGCGRSRGPWCYLPAWTTMCASACSISWRFRLRHSRRILSRPVSWNRFFPPHRAGSHEPCPARLRPLGAARRMIRCPLLQHLFHVAPAAKHSVLPIHRTRAAWRS